MHIVLVDDSIPYDGNSPANEPLGGAEKAFAGLPGALARRGHRVQVFNRAAQPAEIDNSSWEAWQGTRPVACDVLIAYRQPELLGFVATATRRLLWLASAAHYLDEERHQGLLYAHRPVLVFMSEAHRATYHATDVDLQSAVISPGVRSDYLEGPTQTPLHPPYAVATSHPQLGLDWLLTLWVERIHPRCPHAELRLYSAILDNAAQGGQVPAPFQAIASQALATQDKGVTIHRPGADPVMAEAYRGARAHLYPGDRREVYCHTLAESQACALPVVARPFPATAEQLGEAVSGKLPADDDAFARAVLSLLEDDQIYLHLSQGARTRSAGRGWDAAAAAFEAIWR